MLTFLQSFLEKGLAFSMIKVYAVAVSTHETYHSSAYTTF